MLEIVNLNLSMSWIHMSKMTLSIFTNIHLGGDRDSASGGSRSVTHWVKPFPTDQEILRFDSQLYCEIFL